jgi:hypothetical protein
MFGSRRLPLLLVPLGVLLLAPEADAALRAKLSLSGGPSATRLVVKLSSKSRVPARARPRAVSVKARGRTYRLRRARRARSAVVSLGTWRSALIRGARARKLHALAGRRLVLRIRSRAGTTKVGTKLRTPAARTIPPGDVTTPPGNGTTPPAAPGDITGQQAIDRMTAEIGGGAVRRFVNQSGESQTHELHLCADRSFRHYFHSSYLSGSFSHVTATEKFGNPWTVVEALIKEDGSYKGARVRGTFTGSRSFSDGNTTNQSISEPAETLIELQNGQWYWDKQAVQTLSANCSPTL